MMYTFCRSDLMYTKCIQDIYKMYPIFRQAFVYVLFTNFNCYYIVLLIFHTKCIQKFVEMWDTFCIHLVYILYTSGVYILYNFCIQNVYTIAIWLRNKFDALCCIFKQNLQINVSETKIGGTFLLAQFCEEDYPTPYRFDRTCKGGGLLLHVREDIPSKQIKLKFIENKAFKEFFVGINLRKKVACLLLL